MKAGMILVGFLLATSIGGRTAELYLEEVKPLLRERCYACHGALKQKSGLRLDTVADLWAGTSPEELLSRITAHSLDTRMPPEGSPLTEAQVGMIDTWVRAGAPAPDKEERERDPSAHWAFQALQPPVLASGAHPVDVLLEKGRSQAGLTHQSPAPRGLLLRRLYLDITGLPPSLDQLEDTRSVDVILDELLDSPQYGDRWGRHWMDIWRYSDGYGLGVQLRYSQPHLWRWRDWIVESLNQDAGYDQMILEMLAGDELSPGDPSVVRATGFLARNYYLFNRTTWLDNTIEHTSKAFLGLTLNCAKCHDHKYDPITQEDYYRFRAIFEPHQIRLDPVPGETDWKRDGLPRAYDDNPDVLTYLHIKGDPKTPDESQALAPGVPSVFSHAPYEPQAIDLPVEAWAPGSRDYAQDDRVLGARKRLEQAVQALEDLQKVEGSEEGEHEAKVELAELKLAAAQALLDSVKATVAADQAVFSGVPDEQLAKKAAHLQATYLLAQSKYDLATAGKDAKKKRAAESLEKKGQSKWEAVQSGSMDYESLRASQKALETPEHKEPDYAPVYGSTSTGRRLALARWIVHPDNPLTARVAVNHVWMRHFGEPLVPTVFDFGRQAPVPQQLELLDFLAAELVDSGWRLKHLHRLLVTSQAYQMASSSAGIPQEVLDRDPDNQLYWRMNVKRMESQVVRDSLLQHAGTLDLTVGGPSVEPAKGGVRRSLYFLHSRDHQDLLLSTFDDAEILACYRRSESIIPQQALALYNSELAIEAAGKIGANLSSVTEGYDSFVRRAFETLLCREPGKVELAECRAFRSALQALPTYDESRCRSQLVLALLNHNDFVTIR